MRYSIYYYVKLYGFSLPSFADCTLRSASQQSSLLFIYIYALNTHNIILDSQHGFRERLSTVTQLLTSTHDWASTLQHRGQSDAILLDFSKAFDTVPHLRLSAKLSYYGIRGPTLSWIQSFLNGRTQAVCVNGTSSLLEDVTSGVPQGSVLGPALFLIYINDIQDHIQSKLTLFADDSIVYSEIVIPEDHNILQKDLDQLSDWSSEWLMHFNIKKCAVLSITRKRNPSIYNYSIRGESLERVSQHDYLGVTVSNDLRWGNHCNKIVQKASRTLGLLRRTLGLSTRERKSEPICTSEVQIESDETSLNQFITQATVSARWRFNTVGGPLAGDQRCRQNF